MRAQGLCAWGLKVIELKCWLIFFFYRESMPQSIQPQAFHGNTSVVHCWWKQSQEHGDSKGRYTNAAPSLGVRTKIKVMFLELLHTREGMRPILTVASTRRDKQYDGTYGDYH